jgi:hypothetical protein
VTTTDLDAAVSALTNPTETLVQVGEKWVKVKHEPLLTQLEEAVRSSFGGSSAGGSSTTGMPLNSGAMELALKILSQIRDWCRLAGVFPSKDARDNLVSWSIAYQGTGVVQTAMMEGWASDIRVLLDPPRRVPIARGCPVCKADKHTDAEGVVSLPVVVEYDSALAGYDRAAAEATMRAGCRVCDAVWEGRDAIVELMEELGGDE